jgi:hypothetical protein
VISNRSRARRNGLARRPRKQPPPRRLTWGAWLIIFIATVSIAFFAWGASLTLQTPELSVPAALVFALAEGMILCFVGTVWSQRGVVNGVLAACVAGGLAAPIRWELARYQNGGRLATTNDLLSDFAVTLAWAAFAGFIGSTVLRRRLSALIPQR